MPSSSTGQAVVLAVDIAGDSAADGRVLGAGDHGEHQAVGTHSVGIRAKA